MNEEKQIEEMEYIIGLLVDFDEMGFAPTTLCPDPEAYAIEWREKITNALQGYRKASEVAREIFEEIMSAIERGTANADTRIKDLAPYTYKVMMEVGKVYAGEIGKAICEVFKKYTEDGE